MTRIGLVVLLAAVAARSAPGSIDVTRVDLEVQVLERQLRVRTTLHADVQDLPSVWRLELAESMRCTSARAGDRDLPHRREDGTVVLDLSGLPAAVGALRLEVEAEGTPFPEDFDRRQRFLGRGVRPDRVHVPAGVAWYPRAPGDRAPHAVRIDVREGWVARTAGALAARERKGVREIWSYRLDLPRAGLGLVAAPAQVVEGAESAGIGLDAFVAAGHEGRARELLGLAARACAAFEARFGPPLLQRLTLVELPGDPDQWNEVHELGYSLLGPAAFATGLLRQAADDAVVHAVARLWWGGDVGAADFACEALARYCVLVFLEGRPEALASRRSAVEEVYGARLAGEEIALDAIEGFGTGLDPDIYRIHARSKTPMVLAMVADAIGAKRMDALLVQVLEEHRGGFLTYADLRRALVRSGGSKAAQIVRQAGAPGLPTFRLDYEETQERAGWKVRGTILQEDVSRPYKGRIVVRAVSGEQRAEAAVALSGPKTAFKLSLPSRPYGVLLDPDYRWLAVRPSGGASEREMAIRKAFALLNDPDGAEERDYEEAVARLRNAMATGVDRKSDGLCLSGIGRCLFRLGRWEEAERALRDALDQGAGGPVHGRWAHLRLGCIADLQSRRAEAQEHYRAVLASGGGGGRTGTLAGMWLERPYRSFEKDG